MKRVGPGDRASNLLAVCTLTLVTECLALTLKQISTRGSIQRIVLHSD